MGKLEEWHPGNYVFYGTAVVLRKFLDLDCLFLFKVSEILLCTDVQQEMLGCCSREEIACFVLTRIIGRYSKGGRDFLLVDCGWTALTTQGFGKVPSGGYGAVVDHPELKYVE